MGRSASQRKIATPRGVATPARRAGFALGVVSVQRHVPSRVRFCALDGPLRVVIEADSEFEARCLCREMGFEFIGFCD
jgi:hypothetical protein